MTSPKSVRPDWTEQEWRSAWAGLRALPHWWPEGAETWELGQPLPDGLGPEDWRYAVLWAAASRGGPASGAIGAQAVSLAGGYVLARIGRRLDHEAMIRRFRGSGD